MEDDISVADLDKLHLEAAEAALEKTRQTLDYVLQGEGFADLLSAGEALLDWARRELMWQPIETAPRDGTAVIVYFSERTWLEDDGSQISFGELRDYVERLQLGWYREGVWSFAGTGHDMFEYLQEDIPTHWRPILDTEPGKLPDPLEAFAEALKRVRGE